MSTKSKLVKLPGVTKMGKEEHIFVNPEMVGGLFTDIRQVFPYVEVCKICLPNHTLETTLGIDEVKEILAA